MNKLRIYFFLPAFLLMGVCHAQSKDNEPRVIDSMKRIIHANRKIQASSSMLLRNIVDLAGFYRISNVDSAILYYEKSLKWAEEAKVDTLIGYVLEQLGNLYLQKGMSYTALEYFFRNYKLSESKGKKAAMAYALCDIGNIYYSSGLYDVARKFYRQSLRIFQSTNDKYGQSVIYNNLGMIMGALKHYDSAIYFYTQSLRLRQQIGDQFSILHSRTYLAETYLNQNKPEEALRLLDEILFVMNNITLPYGEEVEYRIAMYLLRGKAWEAMKQYGSARENYDAALKLAEKVYAGSSLAEVYFHLALLARLEANYQEAAMLAEKALNLAKLHKNVGVYRNALYQLAWLNERLNRPILASSYYKQSFFYTDSLFQETIRTKLSDVAKAIELYNLQVQKEKEEEHHRRQKNLWITLVVFLFLLFLGVMAYLQVVARSRREFENIANASFEGILIHEKGKIIHLNRRAEELFGRSANQLKGQLAYDYVVPEFREYARDFGESDSEANYQAQIQRPDGSVVEVEILSKPIIFRNRRLRVAAIRDITRLQRLIRENIILWTAAEQMPDMLIITDREGKIIYANAAFEKISGYNLQEVKGQNPRILKSGEHDIGFYERMWKTLNAGNIWSGELLNRKKDGTFFWARTVISPVKDENGIIMYYASVSEDITEKKAAIDELRKKDLLYKQLASNLPGVAVFLINREMKFELAEGKALADIGLKPSDFENKSVDDVVYAGSQGPLNEILKKVFDGQMITDNTNIGHKDFKIILAPLADPHGQIIRALMLMQDISESLQREKRLRENEVKLSELLETKNRFISILAHDLRNPFSSILGFCDLLYDNYYDFEDSQKREFISHIRHSAENTLNLINSLLNWSRLQDNEVQARRVPLKAGELLNEVFESTEFIAKHKGISLRQQVEADVLLLTDRDMLSTILRNLVTNAIKYSNQGGEVILSIGSDPEDGRWAIFQVRDYGVGIPASALSSLFDIARARSTEGTAGEKGSGMGLLLVKEMVSKLGGEILVDSTEGKGAVFTVRLPLAE